MRRFVAYYRVSTTKQGQSGLGLEAQQSAVAAYLNGGRWELVGEFVEIESGKKNDRPQLAQALKVAKANKATLVIAKLDRLARNVHFISGLMESDVDFVACDMPDANRLTIHILAAVAEHEREMISQRTKAALAAAKARGTKLGGSDKGRDIGKAREKMVEKADAFAASLSPVLREIQEAGITSLSGIARALTARGVQTARGGSWTAKAVSNLLERL
jgi:DNA invertase Pin-like site-specific DNA recombinase